MLPELSSDDSEKEKKMSGTLRNENYHNDNRNVVPAQHLEDKSKPQTELLTEKDIRELSKVFMCNEDKTERLTGVELLRILEEDAEKFGEKTQLKALVKRSPMSHLTKNMMKGSGELSCAVFVYPALERLAELKCIELISIDNGKNPDINKPELRDKKGNLKSNSVIVVTDFGRQFINNPTRGRGRPLGSKSSKTSSKKGGKSKKKKKNQVDEKEYHPKRKRKWEDSEAAITLGIITPGDFAFNEDGSSCKHKDPGNNSYSNKIDDSCNNSYYNTDKQYKKQKEM